MSLGYQEYIEKFNYFSKTLEKGVIVKCLDSHLFTTYELLAVTMKHLNLHLFKGLKGFIWKSIISINIFINMH